MPNGRSREIRVQALKAGDSFQSGAMRGYWCALSGDYVVYSYGVIIGRLNALGHLVHYDGTKYSQTTSHHQSALREAWGVTPDEIARLGI